MVCVLQDCLEDNMDHEDFSSDCRTTLEHVLAKRSEDFRLVAVYQSSRLSILQHLSLLLSCTTVGPLIGSCGASGSWWKFQPTPWCHELMMQLLDSCTLLAKVLGVCRYRAVFEPSAHLLMPCRLDVSMHEACADDLQTLCSVTIEEMEKDEEKKRTGLTCLQQFKEELTNQECRYGYSRRCSDQPTDSACSRLSCCIRSCLQTARTASYWAVAAAMSRLLCKTCSVQLNCS